MNQERQAQKLINKTRKILHQSYACKTFVELSELSINYILNMTTLYIRAGKSDAMDKIIKQVEMDIILDTDIYTIDQLAAIVAENLIAQLDEKAQ